MRHTKSARYAAAALLSAALVAPAAAAEGATLELDQPQTAVLDPADWDTVFPNETYFDALRPIRGARSTRAAMIARLPARPSKPSAAAHR